MASKLLRLGNGGDHARALGVVRSAKALELQPRCFEALVELGLLYWETGREDVSDAWTPFWSGDVGGGILAA